MGEHSIHISVNVVNRSLCYHMYSVLYYVLYYMYFKFKFKHFKKIEKINFGPIDKILEETSVARWPSSRPLSSNVAV
jgi:hypothetical protein